MSTGEKWEVTTNGDENNFISIKLFLFFKKQRLVTYRETKSEIRILVRNNKNNEVIGVISLKYWKAKTVNLVFYTQKKSFKNKGEASHF